MKTTIYDLLGMIKDGKEIPKMIMYDDKIYEYQGDDYLYKDEDKHEQWLFSESYTEKQIWLDDFLNDEVEILDEPKENKIEKLTDMSFPCPISPNSLILKNKINELIDEVNKLKEK